MEPSDTNRQKQSGDLLDAKPNSRPFDSDLTDAGGFVESVPSQTKDEEVIPRRKGSVFLETPTCPNAKVYSMNGDKRGKVVIFNQKTFDDKSYLDRDGTDEDVKRLYNSLPRLGFLKEDIQVYEDFSSGEIFRTAEKLEYDDDLKSCDCLVVVILTHGKENDELMSHNDQYHLYKFIECFTPTSLKSLAGKPKIFIVQACRGKKLDTGFSMRLKSFQTSSVKDQVDSQAEIFTYPESADFLLAMSSHYGHFSFRNEQGSWFIQELCNVIDSCNLETDSILDILTETNNAVAKRLSNADGELDRKKQISSFYSTLTKKLFFSRPK